MLTSTRRPYRGCFLLSARHPGSGPSGFGQNRAFAAIGVRYIAAPARCTSSRSPAQAGDIASITTTGAISGNCRNAKPYVEASPTATATSWRQSTPSCTPLASLRRGLSGASYCLQAGAPRVNGRRAGIGRCAEGALPGDRSAVRDIRDEVAVLSAIRPDDVAVFFRRTSHVGFVQVLQSLGIGGGPADAVNSRDDRGNNVRL